MFAPKECVPRWLHLVSKTLGAAVDGGNARGGGTDSNGGGGGGDRRGEGGAAQGPWGSGGTGGGGGTSGDGVEDGWDFGVELEALRTAMALLTHVPS